MNGSADSASAAGGVTELAERVRRLEAKTAALIGAAEALARGLEGSPMAEPPGRHVEEAARRTHELLLLLDASRDCDLIVGARGGGGSPSSGWAR